MNISHRSIWNSALGAWVAVSEITRACGKRSGGGVALAGSGGRALRLHHLSAAMATAWGLVGAMPSAHAACSIFSPGVAVTCTGEIVGLASTTSNMTVTFDNTARVNSVINGLASVSFTGNNTRVVNNGEINPSTYTFIPSLSSGLLIGNNNNNVQSITNNNRIVGTSDLRLSPLNNLVGMAIEVRNGAFGTTTITNNGSISGAPLIGFVGLQAADIPVVGVAGGQVVMTNAGTITGRISFQGSTAGNTFTNLYRMTGSLSMGADAGANRFNAITGSVVERGTGTAGTLSISGQTADFAAAGIVDGGLGSNSALALQNAIGGGSGTNGSGNVSSDTFKNFSNLIVDAGTWTMFGPVLTGTTSTVLNGGILSINNNAALGTGTITSAGTGGNLRAGAESVTLDNAISITGDQLAISGDRTLTLAGAITGSGRLAKSGTGTLILNGSNSFASTTLAGGVTQLGNNAALGNGSITVNSASTLQNAAPMVLANNISLNAALTLSGNSALTLDGAISGGSTLVKSGTNALTLNRANNFTGGFSHEGGRVAIGNLAALGTGDVTLNSGAELLATVDGTDDFRLLTTSHGRISAAAGKTFTINRYNLGGNLSFGSSSNTGTVVFAGSSGSGLNHGTTANVDFGTLRLGDDFFASQFVSYGGRLNVAAGATVELDGRTVLASHLGGGGMITTQGSAAARLQVGDGASADSSFAGTLSDGVDPLAQVSLVKEGSRTLTLSGNNTHTGATSVNAGTLIVNGSMANSAVSVASGAALRGSGTVGATTVAAGGTLQGSAGQALTTGALALDNASQVNVSLGAPSSTRLFQVNGDLTLDGQLNISDLGGFRAGVYRIFDYTGNLANNDLNVSSVPPGSDPGALSLQTAVDKQVNLINTFGQTLQFWDGDTAGHANNGAINGGAGTWTATSGNWTQADGTMNAPMTPAPGFAIFQGPAGTVTAINSAGALAVTGMQFASDGYVLQGDAITLSGTNAIVRVGDGASTPTTTISAALTGSAALEKTDSGTLILTGASSYTGGTLVSGGVLQGNTTGLQGAITNNAAVTFDQTAAGTYAGAMGGSGSLNKTGAGNLSLSATHTFNGATNINAGTLSVNGSLAASAITVNSGGTLGGSGTVGNTTIASGGILAPGNSIGTLTINGNATFAPGSTYRVEVDSAGNNDRTNVTGTANLDGSVAVQAAAGNYAANTTYTILNAAGGRTGVFSGVSSDLAFLDPTLAYDANAVRLTLARNDVGFGAVASTPNQIATANALERAASGVTGDMATVLDALTGLSAEQARAAYDAASGTGLAALRGAGARLAATFGNQLQTRLATGQGGAANAMANALSNRPILLASNAHTGDLSALLATVSDAPPQRFSLGSGAVLPSAATTQGRGFWLRGAGGYQDTEADGNAAASQLRNTALSAGFDTQLQDGLVVGAALSSGSSRLSLNQHDTGKSRGTALAMYGSYDAGPWVFKASASAGWNDNRMNRTVTVGALSRTASSDFNSTTLSAYGEATYSLPMNGWTLKPVAALSVTRDKADGFTETGAGALNLQVAGQTSTSTKALLGAKASFEVGSVRLEPRALWAHEFGDLNTPMTAQFQGAASASPFQVSGVALKRDTLILGLGVSGSLGKAFDLFADMQLEHNSRQSNAGVMVGLRGSW